MSATIPDIPKVVRLDRSDNFQRQPCSNCPWRIDSQPGEFGTDAYRRLAHTAYDLAHRVFTCHKSKDENPLVCAGFLLRGADHNLTVRINYAEARTLVDDAGLELYPNYRAMAVANGLDCDDPALERCRD
ncbi:hypothetical protein KPB05_36415 [Burkholderia gladioli]|uniref:DUF6283 family protein n=1 Tax=Burkholderia gladioli TaxID=28095 RepID=UPI0028568B8D|nr:DUF6283 family protein [Burkholderia gladioli]MDR8092944.1 hypothetical protein [Burkholderia gladioli]